MLGKSAAGNWTMKNQRGPVCLSGWLVCALVFVLSISGLRAQVLPPEYHYDWHLAGARFWDTTGIPTLKLTELGGIPNDTLNDDAAWGNIPQGMRGRPLRILIDTGEFRLSSAVVLYDSMIVEGFGSASRIRFQPGGGHDLFSASGTTGGPLRDVLELPTLRQTWFRVADTSGFRPGRYTELHQENGDWDSNPASWATFSVGHISRIVQVLGDTVFLEEGFRFVPDSALSPQARPLLMRQGIGLFCFRIFRTDFSQTAPGKHIRFNRVADALVQGLESEKSKGSHVLIDYSSHISIRHSYFHDAEVFDGSGTRGYGITLNSHSTSCLIENNRFRRLRHAMSVKHGANGNVLAYNHSVEVNRSEAISDYSADVSIHGHYPFANLIEGNELEMIMVDHYWGPAGPDNVFFRNRVNGWGIYVTAGNPVSIRQHFVGNTTTNTGFLKGAFSLNGTQHFLFGNNIRGGCQPPQTEGLADTSYYRQTAPPYWQPSIPWPAYGYPRQAFEFDAPATWRFREGLGAVCSDAEATPPEPLSLMPEFGEVGPYPNPFGSELKAPEPLEPCVLYSGSGQVLRRSENGQLRGLQSLPAGLYVLKQGERWWKVVHGGP